MCQNRLQKHLFVAEKDELTNKKKEKFDIWDYSFHFTIGSETLIPLDNIEERETY